MLFHTVESLCVLECGGQGVYIHVENVCKIGKDVKQSNLLTAAPSTSMSIVNEFRRKSLRLMRSLTSASSSEQQTTFDGASGGEFWHFSGCCAISCNFALAYNRIYTPLKFVHFLLSYINDCSALNLITFAFCFI